MRRGIALAVAAGFALRVVAVGRFPPGLYHDEAYYGLDAAGVLAGTWALYFPANNGREPLFVYLAAGFVALLGQTPAALRLAAAFVGTAGVAAAGACAGGLFNRRVGVITAWLVAVAPWPVLLGRVGFRAGTLPLVLALAVAATARGARRGDRRWVALGGAMAGATLYTYTAARVLPVLAVAWAGWLAWRRARAAGGAGAPAADGIRDDGAGDPAAVDARAGAGHGRPGAGRAAALWLACALAVAAPLAATFAWDPAGTLGRAGQVSVLNRDVSGGAPGAALARNARGVLGMVFVRGDFIPRHNVPERPVLGWLGGALWLAGVAVMLRRAGQHPGSAFTLAWLGTMALPTLLAENAPHFLRAAGLLPAVLMPAAVGVDAAARAAGRRGGAGRAGRAAAGKGSRASAVTARAAFALAVLAVGAELLATVRYARDATGTTPAAEALRHAFEAAASDLAREVNAARGRGWRGGWAAGNDAAAGDLAGSGATGNGSGAGGVRVWLDRRLRDGWASVPYLVDTAAADVKLNDPYDPVFTSGPGTAFLWPYDLDLDAVWGGRAPGLRYAFQDGPVARGDLESAARPLYLRVDAVPAAPPPRPLAAFADGLRLDAAAARALDGGARLAISTTWSTELPRESDVTATFQVLGPRAAAAAGSDAPLGRGLLPTGRWRPGEQVVERRVVDVPGGFDPDRQRLVVGAYVWPSVARVKVVGGEGMPVGKALDWVEVAVDMAGDGG